MKLWCRLSLLAAIGCGGASKPAAEEPAGAADGGADAASGAASDAANGAAKDPPRSYTCAEAQATVAAFTQHVSKTLAATVGARCAGDGWAQEVINCFAATQDGPELGLCTALLTPEQQRALERQDVPDAVDPNAPPDPACAVLTGAAPAPAPAAGTPGAAAGGTAKPVPLPTLGLPRGAAGKPAGSGAPAPAPGSAPVAPAAGAPGPASPASSRRTIAPRELEQLRLAGETQLAPDATEQRLMSRCRVTRALASFKLCLDDRGAPSLVEPLRSSRLPGYDGKLLAAIHTWRYRPYLVEGKPAEVCSAVTFVYAVK